MNHADMIAAALRNEAEFMTPELDAAIRKGAPYVSVSTAAPGTGRTVRVVATLLLATTAGSASVSEPMLVKLTAKRGFDRDRMAAWWAGKNFPGVTDIRVTHSV